MKRRKWFIALAGGITLFIGIYIGNLYWQNKETMNQTVMYVNHAAVDLREFNLFLNQERAEISDYFKQKYNIDDSPEFWTTRINGEVPLEKAKKAALEQIKKAKVQQLLAKEYGLLENTDYPAFLDNLNKENKRRREAVKNNQIIYGPQQYDEFDYYQHLLSGLVVQMKTNFEKNQSSLSEQDLKKNYEAFKSTYYKKTDEVKIFKIRVSFAGDEQKASAKSTMEIIKQRLDGGESYKEAIQSLQTDSSLKWNIGEELFNEKNARHDDADMLTPQLLDEASKLSVGQAGRVFEIEPASYGIIILEDRKEADFYPFEEVKDNVRQRIIDERFDAKIKEAVDSAKVDIVEDVYRKIRMQ